MANVKIEGNKWGLRMKKKKLMQLAAITALFLPLMNVNHVQAASLKTKAVKILNQAHMKGSVLLIKNGKEYPVNVGYGYYKRKISNGSRKLLYPIGSIQKELTAAMITQLIYQGKFTQNTKISRWFHVKQANQITVGQLMTHTSGFNIDGTEESHGVNFSESAAVRWAELAINLTSRSSSSSFTYNNANYILLAGIIRKVTGKSYSTNLKERIIKPLGLKNTFVYQEIPHSKTDVISYKYVAGRNYQDPLYVNRDAISQVVGAGNIVSTPSDYYRIQKAMTNGKILTAKQFYYMTHLKSRRSTYSGGVYIKKNNHLRLAYGNFGNTHFANWMQLTNDSRNGLVMFLNQTRDNKNQNKAVGYRLLRLIDKHSFVRK